MKLQLYPIQETQVDTIQETQIDPITKLIDNFFKKDVDNEKTTCYNNYIKRERKDNHE